MSLAQSSTPPKGSVKSIISIFESQSVNVSDESSYLLRRSRSMGSLNHKPLKKSTERIEPEKNLELAQIEQQVQHLKNNLSSNYKTYSRESHIYHQNQIVFILTDLGNVETRNNPKTINKKSELTESLKRLNKKLNALLPSRDQPQPVIVKSKNEKIAVRSKSVDEKRAKITKPEAPKEEIEKKIEEKEDEVDSPAVSVKTLKELFEKNTNENEGTTEYASTKISRKFLTFNGTSDLKYVPYSQKYKDAEFNGREATITKQRSFDLDGTLENSYSSRKVSIGSDDEGRPGDLTPDSLSNYVNYERSGNTSGEDSDSEHTARESVEDDK